MEKEKFINELENELKSKNFIKEKLNLNFLNDIDVIGFDLDHTLVIYNNKNMINLLYSSYSNYLISHKNYPKEISYENNEDFIINFTELGLILDCEKGNVLKLSNNKEIIKAFHGKKKLSKEEILKFYPSEKFEEFDFNLKFKENKYLLNNGNFDYGTSALFSLCVEMLDNNKLNNIKKNDYNKIIFDIIESYVYNFHLKDNKTDFTHESDYYKGISSNIHKFIYNYNAMNILKKLKEKGKKIFLATNSFFSYANFILVNSIGENYLDVFDLGFFNCKKPFFFLKNQNNLKCFLKDENEIKIEENLNENDYKKIKQTKILYEGNYKIVENFFKKDLNKNNINFMFIGDDIYNDCDIPSKLNNWKSININDSIKTGFLGEKIDFGKFWNEKNNKNYSILNCDKILNSTEIVLSNIESLKYFI